MIYHNIKSDDIHSIREHGTDITGGNYAELKLKIVEGKSEI